MSPSRIPTTRRTALVGLSIVGLLCGAGVVAGQAASATPTSPAPYTNLVTLQTGSSNVVTSYGSTTEGVLGSQVLTSRTNDCTATWPTSAQKPEIIAFGVPGVAGKVAGLRAGSIGVVDKLTGESCAQVNAPGESLELALPAPMSSAVLDIEVQKDAVITATLTLTGGNSVTRTLRSGQAALNATGDFFACRPGQTSSAPNSGVTDNCRWFIDGALFNRIVLTADQGQFSLEGGGDGAVPVNPLEPTGTGWPTTMTYFAAAAGLNCTTPATLTGTGTIPTVTIRRVTDLNGTCATIPYSLTGAGGSFTFNKPLGDTYAQFYIDAAWKAAVGQDIARTTVDYLQTGVAPVELDWCPAVVYTRNGNLTTSSVPLTTEDAASLPDQGTGTPAPAKEFACIISSASSAPSNGYITVTQRIYLLGDPIMRG